MDKVEVISKKDKRLTELLNWFSNLPIREVWHFELMIREIKILMKAKK